MRHNLAKFSGKATPDEANVWIWKNQKMFRVIVCLEGQKLT